MFGSRSDQEILSFSSLKMNFVLPACKDLGETFIRVFIVGKPTRLGVSIIQKVNFVLTLY